MVLVLLPNPISSAMFVAFMMYNLMLFLAKYFFTLSGKWLPTSSFDHNELSRKVPPFFSPAVTS